MRQRTPDASAVVASMPNRDAVTAQQIYNVLNVIGCLMPALINPWRADQNIPGKDDEMNPEGRIAAENTFRNACERLDKILQAEDRWDTKFQKTVENKFMEAHEAHMEFLDAQTRASEELTAPHFRFRPTIAQLPDNNWVAFLGDYTKEGSGIAGVGATPAMAIEAFDQIFQGQVPAFMIQWLLKRETAMNAGEESPEFPKNNDEKNTLDSKTDRNPENGALGGQEPPGDNNPA